VVASSKPLLPYDEWSKSLGELPWKSDPIDTVWEFDGRKFVRHIVRGGPERLTDVPASLEAACRALRAGPGVEAIRAVAFPVKPRPPTKKHQGTDRPGGFR
jgi:hypothetical protein